jgi:hypothetical protein
MVDLQQFTSGLGQFIYRIAVSFKQNLISKIHGVFHHTRHHKEVGAYLAIACFYH